MIKLKEVSYKYKEGNIGLENINLEFKRGEITMIIGHNGSGKSTLLSCIANLCKYDGEILFEGEELRKIKNLELRKKLGIVFQNPNNQIVFNNVYEDMKFTLENLKEEDIDKKIKVALKKVGMEDFIEANPYNLSLGQKQRIILGSVLLTPKDFILLDEVTSMIDYNGKQEIYEIIQNLKKEHVGIIMTTNIIDELLYADKIIIMNKNHQVDGVYEKKDLFKNLELLKDFYIPLKFKLIQQIGYDKLKKLTDEEILKYVR